MNKTFMTEWTALVSQGANLASELLAKQTESLTAILKTPTQIPPRKAVFEGVIKTSEKADALTLEGVKLIQRHGAKVLEEALSNAPLKEFAAPAVAGAHQFSEAFVAGLEKAIDQKQAVLRTFIVV